MRVRDLSIRMKLLSLIGVYALGFAVVVAVLSEKAKLERASYESTVVMKDLVADVRPPSKFIMEGYLTLFELSYETDPAARRKLIDMHHANPDIGPGDPTLTQGDTTYFTTADKDGMMVSIIQSNYRGMGSGLVADGLGFMFQDRGELYSLDPAAANVYAPGKRPFQTIIPGFVMKDGAPFLAFGLMGGDMQPQGHVQVLTDMIDFGMNVQEAGDAARWYHHGGSEVTGEPASANIVEMESGFDPAVKAALEQRGYTIKPGTGAFGGYQAIMWDAKNGVYWGGSEMRKDGMAIGY